MQIWIQRAIWAPKRGRMAMFGDHLLDEVCAYDGVDAGNVRWKQRAAVLGEVIVWVLSQGREGRRSERNGRAHGCVG